jgi:hypothetical protein
VEPSTTIDIVATNIARSASIIVARQSLLYGAVISNNYSGEKEARKSYETRGTVRAEDVVLRYQVPALSRKVRQC